MDVPAVMVENEIDAMVKDLENRLKYQGLTLEQYMEYTGNTTDKMRDYMRENADRKVKADIVLDAISEAENVEATDEEVKQKAEEIAKMYSAKADDKMVDMLVKAQRPMLENDIKIRKTIDLLVENCKTK